MNYQCRASEQVVLLEQASVRILHSPSQPMKLFTLAVR